MLAMQIIATVCLILLWASSIKCNKRGNCPAVYDLLDTAISAFVIVTIWL